MSMDVQNVIEPETQNQLLPTQGNVQEKRKRKRKTFGTYCAAVGCHNARGNCKLSMFRFPKDEERCQKWVQNTRRDDIRSIPLQKLYHFELCSNHFEDSQFTNKDKRNRLIRNAVPTLFEVPNPPEKVTPSRPLKVRLPVTKTNKPKTRSAEGETPSTSEQFEQVDTPRKRKLKRKVQALRTKL